MPVVGKKKFPYTKKGKVAAAKYAKKKDTAKKAGKKIKKKRYA